MNIPFAVEPRPSTGLTNAKLGMMLFIASEVMLFGAMMASFVFLRTSYDGWEASDGLPGAGPALLNTILMASSSVAMATARSAHRRGNGPLSRAMLGTAMALGTAFVAVTVAGYSAAAANGVAPSTSTFTAIWFVLTGLHALHVAGGLVAVGFLLGPWKRSPEGDPGRFDNRVTVTGLYWHFLTAVWIVTFPVLYFA